MSLPKRIWVEPFHDGESASVAWSIECHPPHPAFVPERVADELHKALCEIRDHERSLGEHGSAFNLGRSIHAIKSYEESK